MQISPVIVDGFENGFHRWIQRIFLVVVEVKKIGFQKFFLKLDPLCGPVAATPLVLEVLCLEVGTSVASAGTAETVFDIIKCMCDVDMRGRVRMESKSQIFMFFKSGYAHYRNISIFRRLAWTVTENTLIKLKCASVRQSTDLLHRGTHNVTKKSHGGAVL